jgi:uncharacterized protein YjbI with pentapeptide repeats
MNSEQIVDRLRTHLNWLNNEEGKDAKRFNEDGVDFLHGDWRNRSMSCAILFDSNFDGCDLRDADFFQAELQGSTFILASMEHVNLAKSNIDGCVFDRASLQHASMKRITASDVDFIGATLTGADLQLSTFIRGNFTGANLDAANLEGCTFDKCRFCGTRLVGVRGVESVNAESSILVGDVSSPTELRGRAVVEWLMLQTVPV